MEENKFEQELDRICSTEQMDRAELEDFFGQLMQRTENQIRTASVSKVQLPSQRQLRLRAIAAVFLMVVSGALLLSCSKHLPMLAGGKTYHGPYELAAGNKLVP